MKYRYIFGAIILVCVVAYLCVSSLQEQSWERFVLGTSISGEDELVSVWTVPDVQGDFYSLQVLELTDSNIERIRERFLKDHAYPTFNSSFDGGWRKSAWIQGPLSDDEQKLVDFVGLRNSISMYMEQALVDRVRASVDNPNSYYAYVYEVGGHFPDKRDGDVTFYLLDLEDKLLVAVHEIK